MRAVLLNGSPAPVSHTGALLQHIANYLRDERHEAAVVELRELELPANDPQFHAQPADHPNPRVRELVRQVAAADIVILGTPLYHGSFSGLIKTALDHLAGDALAGKAVGIASNASGVRGSAQAAQQLVIIARTMQGTVSNRLLGTGKADYAEHQGQLMLTSTEIIHRIPVFIDELLRLKRT